MRKQFLRSDTARHLRLGKKRRKLQKWRRPRGRHSKIRKKRAGYPSYPSIGYKTPLTHAGKISGRVPFLVNNAKVLEHAPKNSIIILAGTVGARKKLELIKKAKEINLMFWNVKEGK